MGSVSGILLRLTSGRLLGIVAQGVELGGDGWHGGECVIWIALLGAQLPAYFRCAQAGRETIGTELWVGLTWAINNGSDSGAESVEDGLPHACNRVRQRHRGR